MSYFLFFIYTLAACWLLYRSSLIRKTGLPFFYWIVFFLIKTGAGCYYGYWYARPENIATADTWRFHAAGLEEYRLLFTHPKQYLADFFLIGHGYSQSLEFLTPHGYWNDLKDHLMQMLISVMDIFSGGHYYVNVVIYSFLSFFGFVFLYLTCKNVLHKTPGLLTTGLLLLTPSCLFWTAGLHRDGFVLLFTAICCHSASLIAQKENTKKHWWILAAGFTLLWAFRNYTALLLAPPVLAWLLAGRYRLNNRWVFPGLALLGVSLFFSSAAIVPALNMPAQVVGRKLSFEQQEGNSKLPPMNLQPSFSSFSKNLPEATARSFLRPMLWQAKKPMEMVAAMELLLAMALLAAGIFFRRRGLHPDAIVFQWAIAFFCITSMIVIGYVVPFTGAIVRYRAIFLMLLLVAASLGTGSKKNNRIPVC